MLVPVILEPGKPYRVRFEVSLAHVQAVRQAHGPRGQKALLRDVEQRLNVAGFDPVLAVLQDPTDTKRGGFVAIARPSGEMRRESRISIVGYEPVEEPINNQSREGGTALDPGLTADEVRTVRIALASDTNPRHLLGLAETFTPFFPVAASIIYAKGMLLELQAARNQHDLEHENSSAGSPTPPARPAQAVIGVLRETGADWPDAEEAFKQIRPPSFPWAWTTRRGHGGKLTERTSLFLRESLSTYANSQRVAGKPLPLSIAQDEAKRIAFDIVRGEPYDRGEGKRHPPVVVTALGQALVTDLGYDIAVVRLPTLLSLMPKTGEEGYVSPSALWLALANAKPIFSRIGRPARITGVIDEMGEAPPEHEQSRVLAKNQMERAERALERRRWVEWYRRVGW